MSEWRVVIETTNRFYGVSNGVDTFAVHGELAGKRLGDYLNALQAENERLRRALEAIDAFRPPNRPPGSLLLKAQDIARAALAAGKEEKEA